MIFEMVESGDAFVFTYPLILRFMIEQLARSKRPT